MNSLLQAILFAPSTLYGTVTIFLFMLVGRNVSPFSLSFFVLAAVFMILILLNVLFSTYPHPIAAREATYRNKHMSAYLPPGINARFEPVRSWVPGFSFVVVDIGGKRQRAAKRQPPLNFAIALRPASIRSP